MSYLCLRLSVNLGSLCFCFCSHLPVCHCISLCSLSVRLQGCLPLSLSLCLCEFTCVCLSVTLCFSQSLSVPVNASCYVDVPSYVCVHGSHSVSVSDVVELCCLETPCKSAWVSLCCEFLRLRDFVRHARKICMVFTSCNRMSVCACGLKWFAVSATGLMR